MRLARLKVETPAPDVSRGILPSPTTCWWYDRLLQRIMFIFSSRNACLHPKLSRCCHANMLSFTEKGTTLPRSVGYITNISRLATGGGGYE